MSKNKTSPEELREIELKHKFFSAQKELRTFLCNKYWKYHGKPIKIKSKIYPKLKYRIGFYMRHLQPTFINDARIHIIRLGKEEYCFCEDEFEIYKKPIQDDNGQTIHFVDVKCPDCSHITLVDMQYLIHKYNCKKCKHTLTVNNRVKR